MQPDDPLQAAMARLRAACDDATGDASSLARWRRALNLVANHPGAVEVTADALRQLSPERAADWTLAWVDTFGVRGLDVARHLLLDQPGELAPTAARVLLGLIVDRGEPGVARRCALAWLGVLDDDALAAQVRATLRVTATEADLVAALSSPEAPVRLGAATLAERRLSGVEPADQAAALDDALAAETDPVVARLLRRARSTDRLLAAIDDGQRDGATLDACLTEGADLDVLAPPGRVSTAMLCWRDGTPLSEVAGRVLLDAIGDEDRAREVPLVALVRRHLDDVACDAFAAQLRKIWQGSSLVPWVPWAVARFGSGSRMVRVASELRRGGEAERAVALLERNATPDARALLERWRGDAWSWLADDGVRAVGMASLLDRGVSSCGLDDQRRRLVRIGHHKLAIELTADGRTRVLEPRTGVVLPRLPDRGHGDLATRHVQRKRVRDLRDEIERTWTQARQRLVEPGRRWTVAAFRHDVLHHPVMRAAATTLRWHLVDAHDTARAMRVRIDGTCVTEDRGAPVELADGVEVVCVGPIDD